MSLKKVKLKGSIDNADFSRATALEEIALVGSAKVGTLILPDSKRHLEASLGKSKIGQIVYTDG